MTSSRTLPRAIMGRVSWSGLPLGLDTDPQHLHPYPWTQGQTVASPGLSLHIWQMAQGNVVVGKAKSLWRAMHMDREGPVSLNPQGRKQALTEHLLCAPWHWVADIF